MISEFPLFVFTTCAGLAAGSYAANAVFPFRSKGAGRSWLPPAVLLALLAVGMAGSLLHLGRPAHVLNALANPCSMICQEAYWSMALGVVLLADIAFSKAKGFCPRALQIVGALVALVLSCIMGYAYFTSYGNAVWAQWPTLLLFVAGNLAMGAAFAGAFNPKRYESRAYLFGFAALEALLAIAFAATAAVFAEGGFSPAPFIAALIAAPVASSAGMALARKRIPSPVFPAVAFACVLAAVAVARYAFYAASIL